MRQLLQADRGLTLVEIAIAGLVSAVLFGAVAAILVTVQGAVNDEQERSTGNDQVRLAVEQLDRELRSATMIYRIDPHVLLAATRSNEPTAGRRCVQWRVQDGKLERRAWPIGNPSAASGWRVVAEHIVNRESSINETTFELVGPTTPDGGATVEIAILANENLDGDPGATVGLETTIHGRNVPAGPSATPAPNPPVPCDNLP